MDVRLVLVPLPLLLVHELFLTILAAVLLFLCARSVTAWGRILTLTEEALQPHLQARSYPAVRVTSTDLLRFGVRGIERVAPTLT